MLEETAMPPGDGEGAGLTEPPGGLEESGPSVRPVQFAPLSPSSQPGQKSSLDLLMDVPLHVTVELGRTTMEVRDLLQVGPGSVIELEKLAGEPVDVLANSRLIARGEVVVIDENFGVRITQIVNQAERMSSP